MIARATEEITPAAETTAAAEITPTAEVAVYSNRNNSGSRNYSQTTTVYYQNLWAADFGNIDL